MSRDPWTLRDAEREPDRAKWHQTLRAGRSMFRVLDRLAAEEPHHAWDNSYRLTEDQINKFKQNWCHSELYAKIEAVLNKKFDEENITPHN